MSQRFTLDGTPELERHLAATCDLVRQGVCGIVPASRLEGLALAGGYGRGEGGVLRTAQGDQPYNDLEFFVFVRGGTFLNDRRYKAALHDLGERLSPAAGIEVEFKIISSAGFRRSPTTMFYYDLVMGHRWLVGDESLLAGAEHHRDASRIPAHEVTRLLFNRCSGLLFAKERLQRACFTPEDADFVARNIAKAQLALGDALLASRGRYHWSCLERHQRLVGEDAIERHHAIGVEFKLHPQRSTLGREDLLSLHAEVSQLAEDVFLQVESTRLNQTFASASAYARSPASKCPEQPAWKNMLHRLRLGHLTSLTRHPRESLLRGLALMLWAGASVNLTRYTPLWHRFN